MPDPETMVVPRSWIHELEGEVDYTFERMCSWDRDVYTDADRRECGNFLNEIRAKLGLPTFDVESTLRALRA